MAKIRLLEFLRDEETGIWSLPVPHREALAREFPEVECASPETRAEANAILPEAEVVFGWGVQRKNFPGGKRLRWIHVAAASVTPLMFPELIESPVIVTNGRGTYSEAMAEHTIGVMLAFTRKLHLARDAQHRRAWITHDLLRDPPSFGRLTGSTLAIVGFGSIGRAIATRARAFGMRVIGVRRRPAADPAPADEQRSPDALHEVLERSDWIVLVAPLTHETRGMIGREELSRMRRTAVLINLGRGGLVDEEALVESLAQGRIAGAGLDVTREEPLPPESPLWAMPNVVLTPHVSGFGPQHWERVVELFRRNLRAYLDGRPLENVVDKQAGY